MNHAELFPALRGKDIVILFDYLEKFSPEDIVEMNEDLNLLKHHIENHGFKVHFASVKNSVSEALADFDPDKVVVFNWCEQIGDNKKSFHLVPYELDKLGFYYTGCDGPCIELTTDKIATKEVLVKGKVPTPISKVYKKMGKHLNGWHNFPSIVKPQAEHSSTGITRDSIIHNTEELIERVNYVIKNYGGGALVEEFIDGPEYFVAIYGYDNPQTLPIIQLDYSEIKNHEDRIYSYNAKWEKDAPEYNLIKAVVPDLDASVSESLQKAALAAYKKTGCSGYARIDMRYKDGISYVLDVNSNPDMTTLSEVIMAANHIGLSYGELVLKLCDMAMQREMNIEVGTASATDEASIPNLALSF
jgi:D-alanine-D-alanine ligase